MRIWDQIRCPECQILLIYDDIKRLADAETFERYERLSFRSAVSSDKNFVWCQQCDFGQLHEKGASEPIVRCLNCGFRSCFVHSGPWHSGFTCDEYNDMLKNPDQYQTARDRENFDLEMTRRLQEEQDSDAAREISGRDKRKEEERQRRRHNEEKEKARVAQLMEAKIKRKEHQQAEKEERERVEELRRVEKAKRKQEKMRKETQERVLKEARRQMENELSIQTMKQTTKQCPGCKWPIEKNKGCDHMTCKPGILFPSDSTFKFSKTLNHNSDTYWHQKIIRLQSIMLKAFSPGLKCGAQFCWLCMSDYEQIRLYGNSRHQPTCQYHTRNLR